MSHSVGSLRCILIPLAAAVLVSGCVGGRKPVEPYRSGTTVAGSQADAVSARTVYTRDVIMPAVARVEKRIRSYEGRLQAWQGISSRLVFLQLSPDQEEQVAACQQQVTNVLDGYRQIHSQLLRNQSENISRQLINHTLPAAQQADITYIEGTCPQFLKSLPAGAGTESLAAAMEAALQSGEYDTVIRAYQSLPLELGQLPAFDVSYLYGLALLKSSRELDARQVFNELADRPGAVIPDASRAKLLKTLADLNFGLGDYASARGRYETLVRLPDTGGGENDWGYRQLAALDYAGIQPAEVRSYAALLLGYLSYNPSRDGFTVVQQAQAFQQQYPASMLAVSVKQIADSSSADAEQWFAGVLAAVDKLSSEQENQQALARIDAIAPDILPLDKQAILKLKKASLGGGGPDWTATNGSIQEEVLKPENSFDEEIRPQSAEQGAEESGLPISALQETWDQAIADAQAKKYDESLVLFSGLLNTSYGAEARKQIEEVSRIAAQENRKQAAELFIRSNHATDPQAQKKLLLSSRSLLEDILRKYPQSGLSDKVRRNLSRIDQELAGLEETVISPPVQFNGTQ